MRAIVLFGGGDADEFRSGSRAVELSIASEWRKAAEMSLRLAGEEVKLGIDRLSGRGFRGTKASSLLV